MTTLSTTDLTQLISECFITHGLNEEDANRMAELLVEGEMRGRLHHGVILTEMYVKRIGEKRSDPVIEWDMGAFVRIDGGNGLGPLVADYTAKTIIQRCRQMGVSFAGVHNESPFAMAGSHSAQIARKGCVGIAICNSRSRVAPLGAYEPVFGPNPIAISFPRTKGKPLTVDFTTSSLSMAEIRELHTKNEQLPDGVAFDKRGNPTRSAEEALEGAVLPFGGHKGYALALAIELLAGPMAGAKAGKTVPGTRGFLIGAWCFPSELEHTEFEGKVQQLLQEILKCKTQSGKPPRVPGLTSIDRQETALKDGLTIDDDLYQNLRALAGRH
ncbi:Ldh family oxidoreductase [candidate division KSB1 bacterium]